MADIFNAYKFLNDALGLNISDVEIARAEMGFRLKFMDQEKYKVSKRDLKNWEFFAHLGPRKSFSKPELAKAALARPLRGKASAKTKSRNK